MGSLDLWLGVAVHLGPLARQTGQDVVGDLCYQIWPVKPVIEELYCGLDAWVSKALQFADYALAELFWHERAGLVTRHLADELARAIRK